MKSLLPRPLTYASGYSLDLYCKYLNPLHTFDEFPHQFFGEYGPDVFAAARANGWVAHKDRTATCPKCNTSGKTCLQGGQHVWPEGYRRGVCAHCGLSHSQTRTDR